MASLATTSRAEPTQHADIRGARGLVHVFREGGATICEHCRVADRVPARLKGLLGKRRLGEGEGLLIRPAPSIHTFFMRLPIDVLFVSREGEILKIAANVRPWRIRSCRRAYAVLEIAAGEATRRGVAAGDRVRVETSSSR